MVRAIASYHVDSLTMGQSPQSAPAVPDDRAGRTRCSVSREKFARDFVSAISRARQTPLCKNEAAGLTERVTQPRYATTGRAMTMKVKRVKALNVTKGIVLRL